ncbi:hypothetical protein BKA64DRAFT_702733 [Cadophora sp. MPI-SDFR-AT-0126]|nr:hypothetical protein BKA64DRAFT_702733 [Leotiomycetes sp. MPI-SDFR-AT-0126]
MYRNNHRRQNPTPSRGRDQYDLPLHQIGQLVVDLISGLGDRGYRGHGFPGRSNMEQSYPDYLDPQDSTPRRNFATADDRLGPQALRPTGRNRHARMNMAGHSEQGEPIGKAMKKLFNVLGDAEKAYRDFQQGFDDDTEGIKRYAKTTSLVDLWRRKVEGDRGDAAEEYPGEQSEDFAETHDTMKKKLATAMGTAILATAGVSSGPSATIRLENVTHLQQKVETANMQIMDVLEKMPRSREYCQSLLNELAILKYIIDPASESNNKLYKAGAGDGNGDAEEDEEEGGGGSWQN